MQHHYKKRARTRATLADVLERVCRVRTLARFAASRPCGKSRKPIIMHSHKHSRLPHIQWKDLLVVVHLPIEPNILRIFLIMGPPQKVPLILRNPHVNKASVATSVYAATSCTNPCKDCGPQFVCSLTAV